MLITTVMERKDFSSYLEGRIHKHIFWLVEHVSGLRQQKWNEGNERNS